MSPSGSASSPRLQADNRKHDNLRHVRVHSRQSAANEVQIPLNASSRSVMISSASSIPTEMRTMPSVMPIRFLPFSPSAACVIVAGCEISVSTPPSDSPNEHTLTFLSIFLALESDPVSKVIMEPKPVICLLANSCCG